MQVQFRDGQECSAIKELYNLLKDHKNPYMQDLVSASYQHSYREEMSNALGIAEMDSQELENCGTENVVRVTLINPSLQPSLTNAMNRMIEARLHVDQFGFNVPNAAVPTSGCDEKRLSDKLTILVNDITIAMKKLEYACYRGKVYKRDPRSMYTYSYKCEARAFVNSLATNEQFKSRLIRDMRKVIDLLGDPCCELFQPLVIDYDLIEVNGGVCWSVRRRAFVEDPIEARQIGKLSPRCFCEYDPSKEADPTYFREILENSLSASDLATFCEDFLTLLNYNGKKHKDKVPCLVGAANSGKTSLFFPIQGLVHHGNIATVTKQRAFNKAMITPFTEVIFIDEADESVLDISDWKILTQGGYTAHDIKFQTAKPFMNRCPMLITAQRKLDFGATHQPAMDRRLRTYHFKSLPNPKRRAAAWLRKHAMECVVWAAKKADECEGDTDNEQADTDSDEERTLEGLEGTLKEDEKDAIRSLSLSSPLVQKIAVVDSSDEDTSQDSTEEAGSADDVLAVLRDSLKSLHPDSLQHRQLKHMLGEEERKRFEIRERAKKRHEARKAALREKGVSSQSAELLPTNPDSATPSPIQRELQRYIDDRNARQEQERRDKARRAFEGRWLRETEKELHDCVEKSHQVRDPYLSANMKAHIEILCDKLKNHHKSLGTYNTGEAIEERRRACVDLGILRQQDQHLVKSVQGPLPAKSELEGATQIEAATESEHARPPAAAESSDDESMFVTPIPSTAPLPARDVPASIPDDCAISDELLRMHSTKRQRCRSQSQKPNKRSKHAQKTILNYYNSQMN